MNRINTIMFGLFCLIGLSESVFSAMPACEVNVLSADDHSVLIECIVKEFSQEPAAIEGVNFHKIMIPGEAVAHDRGYPALPSIARGIAMPRDADAKVKVIDRQYREMRMRIAPSKGFISREVDPADVSYLCEEVYEKDEFYPAECVEIGNRYILRDIQGITLRIYPFAINPAEHLLRFYHRIVLRVEFSVPWESVTGIIKKGKCNRYFKNMYGRRFVNFEKDRYEPVAEQGRMIVIYYDEFMSAIQPYIDWKRQKGIRTDAYEASSVGSSAEDIRAFIQSQYDMNDGLTFVQLVGDEPQVPTLRIDRDFCPGQAVSDPAYSLVDGDDSYPDLFIGRFSARNVDELMTQVERTIYYERDIDGGGWLHQGTGLASVWGEGYGYLGLNDVDLAELLRGELLEYTYTQVDQLYEQGTPPFAITPVPLQDFLDAVNDGRGILNTGSHGDCESSFTVPPGTPSEGHLTIDCIYSLMNEFELPFIFLGAPYLGQFEIDDTLAEAFMRATNTENGAPVGGIAVYASSADLDYASPQAAMYEMVQLLTNESVQSFGGLMYNGACFSIDLYGARGEKTFQSFQILGDASLQVRTDTPEAMEITHAESIYIGDTEFEVCAGLENALACLSEDYCITASDYTDETGCVTLAFEPLPAQTTLTLTVTAYNRITNIEYISVEYPPTPTSIPTFPPPTETPLPSESPTAVASSTPAPPTATPPPSVTPIVTGTVSPGPITPTSLPPTPTEACGPLGVSLWMPAHYYQQGHPCSCKVYVCNPGPETYDGIPLFVILDVFGVYYFAPSFTDYDYYTLINLTPGLTEIQVLDEFAWPPDAGAASGIVWYAAMTGRDRTELFGDWDDWTFGWGY